MEATVVPEGASYRALVQQQPSIWIRKAPVVYNGHRIDIGVASARNSFLKEP